MRRRVLNIAIAFDQLAYVLITFGDGLPDETISSALWRTEQDGKCFGKIFRPIVDWLFKPVEKEHCKLSYLSELNRLQAPR